MAYILVVDDEPALVELLAMNLRHQGHEVGMALDGEAAQRAVRDRLPDAVVLDWMLPGISGIALARQWRQESRTRELPVLMLTARAEERDLVHGLDAGADDYMTKPFSTGELQARVRALIRRKLPQAADQTVTVGDLSLDPNTMRVLLSDRELRVGPTEFKLLRYFLSHPERVHSRSQLLDRVWGDHVFIEERTVDVHIKRLREALGPAAAMIETVRGAGYRLTRGARGA
ncbi:MAG: phosphate regulon transcriptional regulator PhoB [Rubrivivax sp.]|nr:phosphate regulon transcriptional regulator PhoB [Rubrivivax sp.]